MTLNDTHTSTRQPAPSGAGLRHHHVTHRRYTDDGIPTDAFLAADASAPPASDQVTAYSGVPDSWTTSPLGKLMLASFVPGLVRPETIMALQRISMVADAPMNARVQLEHNGKGKPFYRLVWLGAPDATGNRRVRRMYLTADPLLGQWAQEMIAEKRWKAARSAPRPLQMETKRRLQALLQQAHELAKRVSRSTPYRFHGYAIVEAQS